MKVKIFALLLALGAFTFYGCEDDSTESTVATNPSADVAFNPSVTYGSMTDTQGNIYATVTIGTQTWMAENLRTTIYRTGEAIPAVTKPDAWTALATPAYCAYDNTTDAVKIELYGLLYNWYAVVDAKNIAPEGWHVPTEADWLTLKKYLATDAGGKLKEQGNTHWYLPNTGASNQSGFTGLPAGDRLSSGAFYGFGVGCDFWSSTEAIIKVSGKPDDKSTAKSFDLSFDTSNGNIYNNHKKHGFSVRLIKDVDPI